YLRRPLHMAAWNGHSRIVQLLLDNGADINVQTNSNSNKVTPLHEAVKQGQLMCVIYLTQNTKLEVDLRDNVNHTALRYAVNKGFLQIVKRITNHPKWKCPSDPQDPNHPQKLLELTKPAEQVQIDEILRKLLSKSKN